MIEERLDQIAPRGDDTDADLIAYLEDQLTRRQEELQRVVGAVAAARNLLLEARRVAASLPTGGTLTISGFLPSGLDPLALATRRHLLDAFLGEPNTVIYDEGGGP